MVSHTARPGGDAAPGDLERSGLAREALGEVGVEGGGEGGGLVALDGVAGAFDDFEGAVGHGFGHCGGGFLGEDFADFALEEERGGFDGLDFGPEGFGVGLAGGLLLFLGHALGELAASVVLFPGPAFVDLLEAVEQ